MKEFFYTVTDEVGIHARPAGLLIKEASKYKSDITISKGEKSANAKKIFGIMGLAVKCGDEIKVTVCGEDENRAASELENFFKTNI